MRKAVALAIILILAQFIAGLILYPMMPELMVIHWNLYGEADGYGSKLIGLFLIPLIELILIPLFLLLPRIDPKSDPEKLMGAYSWFILIFTLYMAYFYGLTVAWNLGYRFDLFRLLVPIIGLLFFGIGDILSKVQMNWFMGIRTPWTLSSQAIWDETHRLGSKLFKISGILACFGLFFNGWLSLILALVPVIVSGIYTIVYSYKRYREIGSNII